MKNQVKSNALHKGFTIVELLIVIVIIGILSALVLNTISGVQKEARDTARKTDLVSIKKALITYNLEKDDWIETDSGCGSQGNGQGWFNLVNGAGYPESIHNCLKSAGYISSELIDPSGDSVNSLTNKNAYMKYHCGSGDTKRVFLYAKLESLPQDDTATDGTCSSVVDQNLGMNYYVQVY